MEIEVAVPTPLEQTFTYTSEVEVSKGTRVLVPFGRRQVVGVAMGRRDEDRKSAHAGEAYTLKPITKVIDPSPVYSHNLMRLAHWMSDYYCHPLGEVLRTMLPAASSKILKEKVQLTSRGLDLAKAQSDHPLNQVFGKRDNLTMATLKKKCAQLFPDLTKPWEKWQKDGWLTYDKQAVWSVRQTQARIRDSSQWGEAQNKPQLTAEQQAVVSKVVSAGLEGLDRRPFLLHGVTGSGKTEIYLHLIEEVLSRSQGGGQSLLLVPEISLTPQMTRVFENRFPGDVAVVHSAMADKDRWDRLESVRRGDCHTLIGPRSAVFGPFRQLQLILVDEEHDSSYKQGSGLLYHGRDVATVRAKLEEATIVLGSATPSMESYFNAKVGKYHYLQLPHRVSGKPLPEVQLIRETPSFKVGEEISTASLSDDETVAKDIPVAKEVIDALAENGKAGNQAMVLVNRRGYAYYLLSLEEKKAVQCPNCSISLTLHSRSKVLRCHYCDYRTTLGKVLEQYPGETFVAVGFGSEKAENYLKEQLEPLKVKRLDSDILSHREQLETILGQFRNGSVDVLVGTQILAKGHDFPNVTLICLLEVDQLLNLPDFRSGERTFQLLVQAAGRAGRAEKPGKVLVQCLKDDNPTVQAALRHDYQAFAERELDFRRACGYPPFRKMVAWEISATDEPKLNRLAQAMGDWLDLGAATWPQVKIMGPIIPPIATIRGRHRRSLLFASSHFGQLRHMTRSFRESFRKLPTGIRMKLDVDPQSLL